MVMHQQDDKHILYTYRNLDASSAQSPATATLTLKGNTVVGTLEKATLKANTGNVYGGGDESRCNGNTSVILQGATPRPRQRLRRRQQRKQK